MKRIARLGWLVLLTAALCAPGFQAHGHGGEGLMVSLSSSYAYSTLLAGGGIYEPLYLGSTLSTTTTAGDLDDEIRGDGDVTNPQADSFTSDNLERLLHQLARGGGDHLAALVQMLGFPSAAYPALTHIAQRDFPALLTASEKGGAALAKALQKRLAAGRGAHPTGHPPRPVP